MTKKISSFEYKHSTNLGDEIQTIAAIKAINSLGFELDEIVDRTQINTKNNINLMVNGCFEIEDLDNLLKNNIQPIFSNIHINSQHTNIDKNIIEKFKKYQPIGCRDRHTEKIFKTCGVDAFFNYCMTLTLDKRDENIVGDTVFIVDLDNFLPLPKHLKKQKIEYLTHESVNIYSHTAKMVLAKELLEQYKTHAKLVITSKLHCALPCIAMGIPVILFNKKNNKRMQLAQEFIPIHPYVNIDGIYTENKFLPYPTLRKLIKFTKKIFKKTYYHIRYYFYYKNTVDWNPQKIDIEDTKKVILTNLDNLIQKNKVGS